MATVTPNFNWPVPTSGDLVKNGATAIESLGDSIDASFVDLKGGTTGQVLAKASNTDLDYSWVAQDDSNAIQNSIVDAKGDLISATANDTPARLAVGSNGETLVADSSTATGLSYQANWAAGKNKIINGDFAIWQRGTTVNLTNSTNALLADRFNCLVNFSAGTATLSRQTFTPGAAPVAGYEGQFFQRFTTGTTATYFENYQRIENVQTFAGQTVTFSFWAKASSAITLKLFNQQNFGSGGSGSVTGSSSQAITTSWARYTWTFALASLTGKTIGTSSYLSIGTFQDTGALGGLTIDTWGWQMEASNTATAFQTATGTIQGELAACQRYYYRTANQNQRFGLAFVNSTTAAFGVIPFPSEMRVSPTVLDTTGTAGNYGLIIGASTFTNTAVPFYDVATKNYASVGWSNGGTMVVGQAGFMTTIGSVSAYLGFSAEL